MMMLVLVFCYVCYTKQIVFSFLCFIITLSRFLKRFFVVYLFAYLNVQNNEMRD